MNKTIDELCKYYKCDKSPSINHSYAPYYEELFKNKKYAKKILEIGAGSYSCMGRYRTDYVICSSLFVWRDYFPLAEIYAIDISEECLIDEDRITVELCDQSNTEELQRFINKHGGDFDIIIDDGSHNTSHQIISALFLMPHLKHDGIYCVEDVLKPKKVAEALSQYKCGVHCFNPEKVDDCIVKIVY